MRSPILTLAAFAAAISTAPAIGQTLAAADISGGAAFASVGTGGVKVHYGLSHADRVIEVRPGTRGRHHRGRGGRDREGSGNYYADLRDGYDINRNWVSDSYNDWWHDRPDRAFPRWLQSNQDCQRQWWSGGGWRC